jgi:SAM-dependent methyltransferase
MDALQHEPRNPSAPCPFCSGNRARLYVRGRASSILQCVDCGGWYDPNRRGEIVPDADAATDLVSKEYERTYRDNVAAERAIAEGLLEFLHSRLPNSHRYLEVGCGHAAIGLAAVAIRPDVKYTGIELSPTLYRGINPAARHMVVHAPSLELALETVGDQSQDLVIFHHVLEHFPEPRTALSLIRHKLAPGGRIFIEVPNEQWKRPIIHLRRILKRSGDDWFPGHINFFTQESLRSFLISQKFSIDFEEKIPAGRYLNMVKKMLGGETAFRTNLPARLVHGILRTTRLESLIGYGIVLRVVCH